MTSGSRKSPVQSRDAESTKAKILDAAEQEFARLGLVGARTEAIAAQTGVTKAMIYYYYESKEKLYEAVLQRVYQERVTVVHAIAHGEPDPEICLQKLLSNLISNSANNPNWPAIMMLEAMQNKGQYYSKVGIGAFYRTIASVVERGIASGIFRNVDPMHTAVNLVGLCSFYFCASENLKHLWPGKDMRSKVMIQQHEQEAVDMILRGLRAG